MKFGHCFIPILIFGLVVSDTDIFHGQSCQDEKKCYCKVSKDPQTRWFICKKYEYCNINANKEPSCIRSVQDNKICENEKGCGCGMKFDKNNFYFDLACANGEACYKDNGKYSCLLAIPQGKTCESDGKCFCPKVELQSFQNTDGFCDKGKICANYDGMTNCVDQIIEIDQKCEKEACACHVPDNKAFTKMKAVAQNEFCVGSNSKLIAIGAKISHDQLCQFKLCGCKSNLFIDQTTGKSNSVICSQGQRCIGQGDIKPPECQAGTISTGELCDYTSGCWCTNKEVQGVSPLGCRKNQYCFYREKKSHCFDDKIKPGQICARKSCLCYLKEGNKPTIYADIPKDTICELQNGKLGIKKIENPNVQSQCKNPNGCLCYFDQQTVWNLICPGKDECPDAKDIEAQCKENEFCIADPANPCMSVKIENKMKCGNSKGCICLAEGSAAPKFVKCLLDQVCTTDGGNPVCKNEEVQVAKISSVTTINQNEQCLKQTCECKSEDRSASITCNQNDYCRQLNGKVACLAEAKHEQTCKNPGGCLCKDGQIEQGCPTNSVCLLDERKFICAGKMLEPYETCSSTQGCGCKVEAWAATVFTAKLGEAFNPKNPPSAPRTTKILKICKKDEACFRGFLGSECSTWLNNNIEVSQIVTNPVGAAYGSKRIATSESRLEDTDEFNNRMGMYQKEVKSGKEIYRMVVVNCFEGQRVTKKPDGDVFCDNDASSKISISHNDYCYHF